MVLALCLILSSCMGHCHCHVKKKIIPTIKDSLNLRSVKIDGKNYFIETIRWDGEDHKFLIYKGPDVDTIRKKERG